MSTINTAVFVCMNILGLYPNSNFDHGLGGWANDEKSIEIINTKRLQFYIILLCS